ncbi:MAG TPA: ATP-binding cassette domain-containing protein [Chitinophagales bacterium]|nr:ATP-binding cassette domain-containing protein [Chitinophagales bacterium]
MSFLIECTGLSKSYKLKGNGSNAPLLKALDDVSFSIEEGDRLGLIGLNGSGKSTLLKIISGIIKPSSGKVKLYKRVQNLSGFDSMLHPDMTGRQNIWFQLKVMHFNHAAFSAAIDEIIAFSELDTFIDQPVKHYSSGMMLRLSLSMLKVTKPEILLLDEVFSAGDMVFGKKVDQLMAEYFNSVSGIIMASHQLSEISMYCNKCMVLNKGKIEFWGSVNDALNQYIEKNKQVAQNELENEDLRFDNIRLLSHSDFFLYSQPIEFEFEFTKKTDRKSDIVIYINNDFGNVMTDCPLYNPQLNYNYDQPGKYKVKVGIPAHLLNKGRYYTKIIFGDGINDVMLLSDILSFSVRPNEWEADKLWNINPSHPIRARLTWDISSLVC